MAAGTGERFESKDPKKFYTLLDRPMLVWTAERFAVHPGIDSITVVVTPGEEKRVSSVLDEHGVPGGASVVAGGDGVSGGVSVVAGGATRQESVRLGLESLDPSVDIVLIHDAARPCLTPLLIDRTLDVLKEHAAVIPAVPVVDTLVREEDGNVAAIVDRTHISGVQTPQGFHRNLIVRAHAEAVRRGSVVSDDGSLVLAIGEEVRTIPGEGTNIKITYIEDAVIAEAILSRQRR